MSDKQLCVDLCSGLGGFSRAFVDAGWEVITVDIDPKFKPTVVQDVCTWLLDGAIQQTAKLPIAEYLKAVVLMSPPCERFSLARRTWPEEGIAKAMFIAGSCLEYVARLRKTVQKERLFWALENPKGRLRWFLGKPALTINWSDYGSTFLKPTDIWGNISLPMIEGRRTPTDSTNNIMTFNKENRAKRAMIPYGLSQAILQTVESIDKD